MHDTIALSVAPLPTLPHVDKATSGTISKCTGMVTAGEDTIAFFCVWQMFNESGCRTSSLGMGYATTFHMRCSTPGSIFMSIGAKSMRRNSLHEDAQICLYDRFEFEFVLLSGRLLSNKCRRLIPILILNISYPIYITQHNLSKKKLRFYCSKIAVYVLCLQVESLPNKRILAVVKRPRPKTQRGRRVDQALLYSSSRCIMSL